MVWVQYYRHLPDHGHTKKLELGRYLPSQNSLPSAGPRSHRNTWMTGIATVLWMVLWEISTIAQHNVAPLIIFVGWLQMAP